jgi:hypothetical protein
VKREKQTGKKAKDAERVKSRERRRRRKASQSRLLEEMQIPTMLLEHERKHEQKRDVHRVRQSSP